MGTTYSIKTFVKANVIEWVKKAENLFSITAVFEINSDTGHFSVSIRTK